MKQLLAEMFIWWQKETLSLRIRTWLKGKKVGTDQLGNEYYVDKHNDKRRWVIYNGVVEASAIEPGWHAWIHHRTDILPTEEDYKPYDWQKPHHANLTGTSDAYRPQGSLLKAGQRAKVSADYEPFKPE